LSHNERVIRDSICSLIQSFISSASNIAFQSITMSMTMTVNGRATIGIMNAREHRGGGDPGLANVFARVTFISSNCNAD
jgi:hypothetical protein